MLKKVFVLNIIFLFLCIITAYAEEAITITTYYPSPYGSYNELSSTGNTYLATSSGNVGIGTSSPGTKLHIYNSTSSAIITAQRAAEGNGWVGLSLNGASGGVWSMYLPTSSEDLTWARGATVYMSLNDSNGYLYVGSTGDATYRIQLPNTADNGGRGYANQWIDASSVRYKSNIKPIKNALDKTLKLRGVSFDWKENGVHGIGLIAEEVAKVIPEVVAYEDNGKDATGLSYDHLVALLVEAIKAQQKEMDNFDKELTELKAQLKSRR